MAILNGISMGTETEVPRIKSICWQLIIMCNLHSFTDVTLKNIAPKEILSNKTKIMYSYTMKQFFLKSCKWCLSRHKLTTHWWRGKGKSGRRALKEDLKDNWKHNCFQQSDHTLIKLSAYVEVGASIGTKGTKWLNTDQQGAGVPPSNFAPICHNWWRKIPWRLQAPSRIF